MSTSDSLTLIRNNQLLAPYFIFVRCANELSDIDLLQRFELSIYKQTQSVSLLDYYAILANDAAWTLLADNWRYSLWHNPSTRPAIEHLASSYDVFACSIGDCDDSFDFVYYQNAQLVRKYVVTDPHFRGGTVTEDFGEPFSSESNILTLPNQLTMVLKLASSLGIKTDYKDHDLRIYALPKAP